MARPGWDVPTKTRLDLNAGGDGPPAEPERAQGSGPGSFSTSPGPAADASGFIDALNALSAHLRERELIEDNARRTWGLWLLACLGVLGMLALEGGGLVSGMAYYVGAGLRIDPAPAAAIVASAAGTGYLAAIMFGRLLLRPIRMAPDSADRVALRHEDSPLRDRIRIAQWVLFDTTFTRFCLAERAIACRIASAVMAVSATATLSVYLLRAALSWMAGTTPSTYDPTWANYGPAQSAVLAFFLVIVLITIVATRAGARQDLSWAQHYGRQVLTLDRDFGGFLPLIERNRVQRIVGAGEGRNLEGAISPPSPP